MPDSGGNWPQRFRTSRAWDTRLSAVLGNPEGVLFLDIETTGLSRHYDVVTLVGWSIASEYGVHIQGDSPEPMLTAVRAASSIVTFNGTLFDLPFLTKAFPNLSFAAPHIDLRYLARRVGLTGGQKAIEKELGIDHRVAVREIDGAAAVLLWHRYLRGDMAALRQLIAYNQCDVISMKGILDSVVARLPAQGDLFIRPASFFGSPTVPTGWAVANSALPPPERLGRQHNTYASLFAGSAAENALVVGIDLTGSEERPSGWSVLRGDLVETSMVATDEEIVQRIIALQPALVSIDSPLSIPLGRQTFDDSDPGRREFGIMRRCERELKRRGINVYPCLLPSMQKLTARGMQLANRLRQMGYPVIESYPGAAQDIMGLPRKGAGVDWLKLGLAEFGIRGDYQTRAVRHDELDAITSALVGTFFLAGKFEALRGPAEGSLVIPDMKAKSGPLVIGISGRIAAGKTTLATLLAGSGFAYTRISLVIDEVVRERGRVPDRVSRQEVGLELNLTRGQRWLCERTIERVRGESLIVIDGLRFLDDYAFFVEEFGAQFVHVQVTAPVGLRETRYSLAEHEGRSFAEAEAQPVEQEIDRLAALAAVRLDNSSTIEALHGAANSALRSVLSRDH